MAPRKKKQTTFPNIRVTTPSLKKLEFDAQVAYDAIDAQHEVEFGFGLNRLALNQLGVELLITIKTLPNEEGKTIDMCIASYRAGFEIEQDDNTTPDQIDDSLKVIATHLGPSTLYPFVREVIANTFTRAGLVPIVLPFVNFRSMMEDMNVEIPAIE